MNTFIKNNTKENKQVKVVFNNKFKIEKQKALTVKSKCFLLLLFKNFFLPRI